MYRLIAVSVRGPRYLIGARSVHPISDESVPPREGTLFDSIADAKRYTRRELTSLSCYHQVQVVDETGTIVTRGHRTGRGGTGKRWSWVEAPQPNRPTEPADQQ